MAALATIAFAAGCGGGSDTTVTTSSISKPAFLKQANAICEKQRGIMLKGLLNYEKENLGQPVNELAREAIQAYAPQTLRAQAEEIRALGAPAGDAAKVEAYTAALEGSIQAIEEGEPTSLGALQTALEPVHPPAAAYGLDSCDY